MIIIKSKITGNLATFYACHIYYINNFVIHEQYSTDEGLNAETCLESNQPFHYP